MKTRRPPSGSRKQLRDRAEKLLTTSHRDVARLPVDDVQKLVQELQVHQIELEMQNEELRRTQQALEDARDRYANLYDFAPAAHLTVNAEGEILEANLAAGRLLDLERGRLLHQKFTRFVTAESQDNCYLLCRQIFNSATQRTVELNLVTAQGKRLLAEVAAVRDATSHRKQCRLCLTDITKRRQAEDALLDSKDLNEQIIAGAREGIVVNDRDLKHLVWNPFMEELTGVPAAKVLGKHPAEVFPFLRKAGIINQMERALAGETLPPLEVHFHVPQSGRSGWASNSSSPLRNARGDIIGVIGIVTDISKRKQAEAALKAREAQLHSFVHQAPAAIAMFDRNMNYVAASKRWTTDHGHGESDLVGRNHYQMNPDLPERWKEVHRHGLAGKSQSRDEDLWVKADGTELWFRWTVNPWLNSEGKIGGIMILVENITQQKNDGKTFGLFRSLVNQSSDTFEVVDPKTGRFLDVNENGPAELGCTRAEYLSLRVPDLDPTFSKPGAWSKLADQIRAAGCLKGEGIHRRKDGRTFPIEFNAKWIRLDRDYIVTVVRDISARKKSEEHITRLNRVLAVLGGVDRAIVHIADAQKLMSEICRVAVKKGGFKLAWIGMVSPGGTVEPVAQAGAVGYLEGIRVLVKPDEPEGRGPVGEAIRRDWPVVIEDINRDERMSPWQARALKFGLHYAAVFPIRIEGKVAGSFQVYAPHAGFFDAEELGLLTQVSDDISFALTAMSGLAARQQAEESLRRSEHNLSIFFNQAPIGLLWLSASGTILRVNQTHLDLLGFPAAETVGHSWIKFCLEPAIGREILARLAIRETVRNLRMSLRCQDGTRRHVLVDANSFWNNNQFQYSSVFLRDITDLVKLELDILQITDREHRRIAQDLHDGLGQLLVGAAYLASNLRKDLAVKSPPEARQTRRILEVLNEAIAQTRGLARGLHPVEPEWNGLMVALQALAGQTQKLIRIRCQFNCPQPVMIPDNVVATNLFRIAQEAITNAIKHGNPGRIKVSLTATTGQVRLVVNDNGMDPPARRRKKPGMGLRIMRYRAGMIGGSLTMQKEADGGTTVICIVPISGEGKKNSPPQPAPQNEGF